MDQETRKKLVEKVEKAVKYQIYEADNDMSKEAYLYEKKENNKVQCKLCPRNCIIGENGVGFCKVRKNIGGKLWAQSYGKATHITIEKIETEAVFNAFPGEKILSLGNFGCNLECAYCQNWMYANYEYTSPDKIHQYSSQEIIERALKENIKILSWTYNDPAVWFEFVVDTAKEARKHGLLNLFKSAFFLSTEAVAQLIDVIDIFAISIKSIDKEYYKKFTKGWLQPVLDNAKQVYNSGRYFEVSNLVVTDLTNNIENYQTVVDFFLKELGPEVPLHFTRFHPDYKWIDCDRTPLKDVEEARDLAIKSGIHYSYVGNSFESKALHSYCPHCKEMLVERYGLAVYLKDNLAKDGTCKKCGHQSGILLDINGKIERRKELSHATI